LVVPPPDIGLLLEAELPDMPLGSGGMPAVPVEDEP
jgi:hypothetical protein